MTDKLLVIAAFDSQLKVASHIAREFVGQGWSIVTRVPRKAGDQLNNRQIAEFSNFTNLSFCANRVEDILDDSMSFSAILLMVDGHMTQSICHFFYSSLAATQHQTRPILITGFVGVGLFDTYIGYQRRLLSDVLFLNANKDLTDCQAVCRTLGIRHDGLLVSGLPFLGVLDKEVVGPGQVDTVLFAGQPDVPERIIERIYMLEAMIEYARRFPQRKVLFKPRHKPGEKTLHPTLYHYETLLASFLRDVSVPENFSFVYGPIGGYLEQSQLFITVSSTAAFEAMQHGCHIAVISDLGISEEYGNKYFMDSGMLSAFSDLYTDSFPNIDWGWIEEHMDMAGNGAERIFEATVAAQISNKHSMSPPYDLRNLQDRISIRVNLEANNRKIVRNLTNLAIFYLKRAVTERRIF